MNFKWERLPDRKRDATFPAVLKLPDHQYFRGDSWENLFKVIGGN